MRHQSDTNRKGRRRRNGSLRQKGNVTESRPAADVNFELMMTIRLPVRPPGMGDEEWFHHRSMEIMSHKPPGTEVKWENSVRKWHTDEEGYTYVPLYCRSDASAHLHWVERYYEAEDKLRKIKKAMEQVLCGIY